MQFLTKSHMIIIGSILVVVLFFVLVFTCVIPGYSGCKKGPDPTIPVKSGVSVWGVLHDEHTFEKLKTGYPVGYTSFDLEEYEEKLLSALAAGEGPDVFMIHSSQLPKFADKIVPLKSVPFNLASFERSFPLVVKQDFVASGNIYALPLYLDTMALFYNVDMFDDAGIIFPPATWSEFQDMISRLRRTDEGGSLTRAAAALGGSDRSINRATDILNLLFLQSGMTMVDSGLVRARFAEDGATAFKFYLQFADPKSPYYTWNDSLPNSLDAFAEEKAAVIFTYAYNRDLLKQKNAFLRYRVAPMLQQVGAERDINYANYWGLAVSKQSKNPTNAWKFILSLTTDPAMSKKYLEATNRPPALLSIINERLKNPNWEVFSKQALTARSWFQIDNAVIENALSTAIADVLTGRGVLSTALRLAEGKVNDVMRERRDTIKKIFLAKEAPKEVKPQLQVQ